MKEDVTTEKRFRKMIHGYHGDGKLVGKHEFFYDIEEVLDFIELEKQKVREGFWIVIGIIIVICSLISF